ncbi:hypothetical protein BMS3Abin04_00225 [bacterium BMS3Abin04]|nr:hypothetical protein BMS3Abin04_00225 [bacterium BMS3Abin04]
MYFDWKDRSNYFKGLLLLIGKDFVISKEERSLLKNIGKTLGFENKFIEDSITNLLENQYIIDEPPEFSNKEIAKIFIKDGIKLAISDKELHPFELEWLKEAVRVNNLKPKWFSSQLESIVKSSTIENLDSSLELNNLVNDSSLHGIK